MKKIFFILLLTFIFTNCTSSYAQKEIIAPSTQQKSIVNEEKQKVSPKRKTYNKTYKKYKKPIKSYKKKSKKSKIKTLTKEAKSKKPIYKSKKLAYEPYSIEAGSSDPELLGPQTTLEKNPLKKEQIVEKKKS